MITVDFSRIPVRPGWRILDAGCGSGRHIGEAVRFRDVQVIGTDLNPSDLREAVERINLLETWGEVRGQWHTAAADVTCLPFADGHFDLVICSEVLEHIPDHARAAGEIIRVLKPGGHLVVSVPRYVPEKICWMLSAEYRNTPGGHIRIYKKKEVFAMLEPLGVRLLASHFAHSLHTPYWWLRCLTGTQRSGVRSVAIYHRFLVWDMMKKPWISRFSEKLFDPVMGKSLVLYFRKSS